MFRRLTKGKDSSPVRMLLLWILIKLEVTIKSEMIFRPSFFPLSLITMDRSNRSININNKLDEQTVSSSHVMLNESALSIF